MATVLGGGKIRIDKGDTLWGLAERFLGSGARWKELGYGGNPNTIPIGTVITLPSAKKTSSKKKAKAKPATSVGEAAANQLIAANKKLFQEQISLYKKLFVNDPMAIDKGMTERALTTAREKLNPEYERALGQFTQDVGIKLGSLEDSRRLLEDLGGATEGVAGASRREYDRAINAAKEGLAAAGTYFGGTRGLGVAEGERQAQLEQAGTGISRQFEEFGRAREEGVAAQAGRDITKTLGQEGFLKSLTSFGRNLPKTQAEFQSGFGNLINTFLPALQGGGVELPQPFKFSGNIGL